MVSKDSGDNVRESEELAAQFWSQRPGAVKPPLEYSVEWALELAMERLRMLPYLPEALERCVRGMKDPKVLEVGCGMGFDGAYLVHSGARYTGLDRPQTVLHAARVMSSLAGSDWTLRSGDATKLPFVDGEFDVVYSFGVLHHIPRVSKAIVEAMRVLRHGGRFVAMVYNYDSVVAAAYRHASNREGTTDPYGEGWTLPWSVIDVNMLLGGYLSELTMMCVLGPHDRVPIGDEMVPVDSPEHGYHMLVTGVRR